MKPMRVCTLRCHHLESEFNNFAKTESNQLNCTEIVKNATCDYDKCNKSDQKCNDNGRKWLSAQSQSRALSPAPANSPSLKNKNFLKRRFANRGVCR